MIEVFHGRVTLHHFSFLWRPVEEIVFVALGQRDIGGYGLVDDAGSGASTSSSEKGQLEEVLLMSSFLCCTGRSLPPLAFYTDLFSLDDLDWGLSDWLVFAELEYCWYVSLSSAHILSVGCISHISYYFAELSSP